MKNVPPSLPSLRWSRALLACSLAWSGVPFTTVLAQAPAQETIDAGSLWSRGRTITPFTPSSSENQPDDPYRHLLVYGRDFYKLETAQRTSGQGIEVIVFFHFESPWSQEALDVLEKWQTSASADQVRFAWAPAVLDDEWMFGARVFYALEHMRRQDLVPLALRAVQRGRILYRSPKSWSDWLETQGIDASRFQDAINAPLVIARASSSPEITGAYEVLTVPTLIVEGVYHFAAHEGYQPTDVVEKARALVEQFLEGGPRP